MELDLTSIQLPEESDTRECAMCDGKLVIKNGKYGKFWGCTNFPECDVSYSYYSPTRSKEYYGSKRWGYGYGEALNYPIAESTLLGYIPGSS